MTAVRKLHSRSIGIAVDRDDFHAQPLQFECDFLTQFATT